MPPQKHLKTWKTKRNNKGEAIKTLDTLTPVEQGAQENEEYEEGNTPKIKRLSLTSICIYSRASFVSLYPSFVSVSKAVCGFLFMFIWLCVCRLTGSARIKVGSSKSAPVRAVQPPPSLFSLLSLSLSQSVCLRSYFYLRGELECCQIVILLLRCVFIHSFDSHSHSPSLKPPCPVCLCLSPTPRAYPFSSWQFLRLRQFRRLCRAILVVVVASLCVCFLFCHAPFTRVCSEQMFYLNAHYYYSISTSRI